VTPPHSGPGQEAVARAAERVDQHVREIVAWHFSPETGTPYWLDWAAEAGRNPIEEVKGFADLLWFPHFDGELLRRLPHDRFIPRAFEGKPFHIFETGGTTGMPKQRIQWNDYKIDYEQFSDTLDDDRFPRGGYWLMVGPTGPRRLRLAIEHLANHRGCSCYFVDLDPRWVKKLITAGDGDGAKAYMRHVIDQAMSIIENRSVSVLFTTPKLLEALSEKTSIPGAGIKGVFCGGTEMSPQYTRFLIEEVLEGQTQLVPTYGNTLMGLACHKPLTPEDKFSITYHAPQPRALMRVVDGENPERLVEYGEWGRVELTTLTQEFFMPRFLERDEAIRRPPCDKYPWDGVGEVRPFRAMQETIVEGVY
jgi:phenylacetate-coenzyme A ligase PaaK-like adenylate-forming protein